MKLQKFLLAAMAVVIAAATVAFYMTPQPILDENMHIEEISYLSVYRLCGETDRLEEIDVTDQVDADEVERIMKKYTRSRWSNEIHTYQLGENQIDLHLISTEKGGTSHMITLGGNEIGGRKGGINTVYIRFSGEYKIHNAAALRAELTALLPD